jgi:hypothetical protein
MKMRSQNNVTYYDYTQIKRFENADRFTVAEAFIYGPGAKHHLGIVVSVSGAELNHTKSLPLEVISIGEALRARLVEQHRGEAETLTANRTYVFDLDGRRIE